MVDSSAHLSVNHHEGEGFTMTVGRNAKGPKGTVASHGKSGEEATIVVADSLQPPGGPRGFAEVPPGQAKLFGHGKPAHYTVAPPRSRIVICAVWCTAIDKLDKYDHEELIRGGFVVPGQSRACPALPHGAQHFVHCCCEA